MPPLPSRQLPSRGDIVTSRMYRGEQGHFHLVGQYDHHEESSNCYGNMYNQDGSIPAHGGFLCFSRLLILAQERTAPYRYQRFPWRDFGEIVDGRTAPPAIAQAFGLRDPSSVPVERVWAAPLPVPLVVEPSPLQSILVEGQPWEFGAYPAPWCSTCQQPVGLHWVSLDKGRFYLQVECHGITGAIRLPVEKVREITDNKRQRIEFASNLLVVRVNSWDTVLSDGFLEDG